MIDNDNRAGAQSADQLARGEATKPSIGRWHTWFQLADLGYEPLGDHLRCRDCGVTQSELNRTADNCPGSSKGAPRSDSGAAPRGDPMPLTAGERMVWAAAFAATRAEGLQPLTCVTEAAATVLVMRSARKLAAAAVDRHGGHQVDVSGARADEVLALLDDMLGIVAAQPAAAIAPGWRKAPPTVEEVRACAWWWHRAPDIEPAVVQLDVPIGSDVIVDAGDAGDCAPSFDPEDWGGADAEWAPCLPPGSASWSR